MAFVEKEVFVDFFCIHFHYAIFIMNNLSQPFWDPLGMHLKIMQQAFQHPTCGCGQ